MNLGLKDRETAEEGLEAAGQLTSERGREKKRKKTQEKEREMDSKYFPSKCESKVLCSLSALGILFTL